MWNVCATRSHRVIKSHKGRRMKNMFLVFSSITHTCRCEAKTTHAHTHAFMPQICNTAILGLFSKHYLLGKKLKHAQMKVDMVSIRLGAVMFTAADVFGSVIHSLSPSLRLSHLFPQIYTFKPDAVPEGRGMPLCWRGAIYTFFALACWDQWW